MRVRFQGICLIWCVPYPRKSYLPVYRQPQDDVGAARDVEDLQKKRRKTSETCTMTRILPSAKFVVEPVKKYKDPMSFGKFKQEVSLFLPKARRNSKVFQAKRGMEVSKLCRNFKKDGASCSIKGLLAIIRPHSHSHPFSSAPLIHSAPPSTRVSKFGRNLSFRGKAVRTYKCTPRAWISGKRLAWHD